MTNKHIIRQHSLERLVLFCSYVSFQHNFPYESTFVTWAHLILYIYKANSFLKYICRSYLCIFISKNNYCLFFWISLNTFRSAEYFLLNFLYFHLIIQIKLNLFYLCYSISCNVVWIFLPNTYTAHQVACQPWLDHRLRCLRCTDRRQPAVVPTCPE